MGSTTFCGRMTEGISQGMSLMFSFVVVAVVPQNFSFFRQAGLCRPSLLFISRAQKQAVTLKMLPQRGAFGVLQAEVLHKFIMTYIIDLYYVSVC